MFHRTIFPLLILVVSLAILIAVPFVSLVHEHRSQEYSKYRAYQALFKITHRYKTIQ